MTTRATRAGVVVDHPIQYFSPLFDLLHERGRVTLRVLYGNDAGLRPQWDAGFNVEHRWDVDLVAQHDHEFATRGDRVSRRAQLRGMVSTLRFVRRSDVLVVHGYVGMLTVVAIVSCWLFRKPYWLRSDTSERRQYPWWDPRERWPRLVYRRAQGALASGQMNAAVAARLGARSVPLAPFAVDIARFRQASKGRGPGEAAKVVFAGKFYAGKRPQDVVEAARRLPAVEFLMVGEGPLGQELRAAAKDLTNVTFTGFVNQATMPAALSSAHVVLLPSEHEAWGLVINEAMACGLVPVVSEAVGCAPDLVAGLGETFVTGDVEGMCAAIEAGLATARDVDTPARVRERVDRFSLEVCAQAYEAALTAGATRGAFR